MDCILYHSRGNCLGSDNGLVVTTEKVLVLIYLRVKIMMLVIYFQVVQHSVCVCVYITYLYLPAI